MNIHHILLTTEIDEMLFKISVSEQYKLTNHLPYLDIIGSQVTATPFKSLIQVILRWAANRESKFICVANTHMLVEAYQQPSFRDVLQKADVVTPDGMPLVWMLKLMGAHHQDRVAGLDLLNTLCQQASEQNISIYFLGSMDSILQKMRHRLQTEFPNLSIAAMEPLPFRPLTPNEDQALVQRINDSKAGIVMLALGCPKQERWMAAHQGEITAVMIGLGGAFPVYAGVHRRANRLIRNLGLEWFYRLIQEPKRLWKRYATSIPVFVYLAFQQLCYHYLS